MPFNQKNLMVVLTELMHNKKLTHEQLLEPMYGARRTKFRHLKMYEQAGLIILEGTSTRSGHWCLTNRGQAELLMFSLTRGQFSGAG